MSNLNLQVSILYMTPIFFVEYQIVTTSINP